MGISDAPVTIEAATSDDLVLCARLICSVAGGRVHDRARSLGSYLGESNRCLLVARRDGHVVGYAKAEPHDLPVGEPQMAPSGIYLGGIVVEPAARRCGIATAMTVARMTWAAERASEVWYVTSSTNSASLDLHRQLGFVEVMRHVQFPGLAFTGGHGVLCRASLA